MGCEGRPDIWNTRQKASLGTPGKEWPQQAGSNLMVDHYYGASRTTETQQKEKVVEPRHLIHQVLYRVGHFPGAVGSHTQTDMDEQEGKCAQTTHIGHDQAGWQGVLDMGPACIGGRTDDQPAPAKRARLKL